MGELALLTDAPRSATVVAHRDSTLRRLGRKDFDHLVESEPVVMRALASGIARQLQRSRPDEERSSPTPKVIAVVALDGGVNLDALGRAFHAGLAGYVRTCLMHEPSPGALQQAEEDHDRVILVAGPDPAARDAALRQADRAVLVSSHAEPLAIAEPECACDVVVIGSAPTPAQVARWHEGTGCRRVYSAGADPERWGELLHPLIARVADRSVALVLAGGGARALSHLGILHAIEEAGVVVDRVAGTSMGALIAAAYATGATAAEVDRLIFDEIVVGRPFRDWRPSRVSLARGERARTALRHCFGESSIEALPRELVIVSTDLYRGVPVYHRLGSLADALAASVSLPVLFPPVRDGRRVLVDGALTDNCPTRVFTEVPEGPVLAVQIGGASIGGHRTRLPSLGETLLRVMQIGNGSSALGPTAPATVTVMPDTRGIGLLEFHQIDEAREAGLQAGRAAVAALRQANANVELHDSVKL
jgi:predicted acylesterase/phospholipase RssA